MLINEVFCKSLVTKSKLPDADYVINPYIGCGHGCVYCYARFMARFTGHATDEWGSFIDVKQYLGSIAVEKYAGKTILIGSVTDPYNPVEKRYKRMRDILSQLRDLEGRVDILTKSPLVIRDIDLMRQIKHVRVGISLSTLDEAFSRVMEPHAATPRQRVDALTALSKAGIIVYAFIAPIFPFLSDWKATAKECLPYVSYCCFENLNLRGAYKQDVLLRVSQEYPLQAEAFAAIFNDKKHLAAYWRGLEEEIKVFLDREPHKIYFYHEKIKKK